MPAELTRLLYYRKYNRDKYFTEKEKQKFNLEKKEEYNTFIKNLPKVGINLLNQSQLKEYLKSNKKVSS